jgi:gamma-glutamyl hydrolase
MCLVIFSQMKSSTFLLSLTSGGLTAAAFAAKPEANDWPVIGMFTQPTSSSREECGGDCLYLAASYVKYIESAGARVVPINYYATNEQLDYLFDSLNGFFFVGGGATFPETAQYIYDKTIEANDRGDFMPLWGTCMGFQWLLISTTRDVDVLDPKNGQFDAYNISLPLEFTSTAKKSKFLRDAPPEIYKILESEKVTMNNHHYGIYTEHFQATEALTSFYDMTSVNKDRNGVEFVSTMEAFNYPIYGVQWHPEKNIYE